MVREHGGDGEIVVPPTIHALLQARIDSLDGDVRVVMERASVEGEVFHRGAVAELSPDPVRADGRVASRDARPQGAHPLDARRRSPRTRGSASATCSSATPRTSRCRRRRVPSCTSASPTGFDGHDLVERDEIVGYHLEQAHRYRAELDGSDAALDGLARRASACLAAAGRGALERGDFNAGRSLFGRATSLLPEHDEARLALAPDYADALLESNYDEAWNVLSQAREAVDPATRAHAAVSMAAMGPRYGPCENRLEDSEAWRNEARAVFEESGGRVRPRALLVERRHGSYGTGCACRRRPRRRASLAHLERAGERGARQRGRVRGRLGTCYYNGPMPVDEAARRIRALRQASTASSRQHGRASTPDACTP